eukprot:GHVR01153007.1.p1 GENE.GHVR01153007.1~~GHVR01153007.1.p1  ORF type:complete len:120 (-),score=8.08 GHVR01153007.1:623-982(-)
MIKELFNALSETKSEYRKHEKEWKSRLVEAENILNSLQGEQQALSAELEETARSRDQLKEQCSGLKKSMAQMEQSYSQLKARFACELHPKYGMLAYQVLPRRARYEITCGNRIGTHASF